MTAPLSQDLRIRIRRAVEAGSSRRQTAERFEVSPSAVIKLIRRVHQTGSTAPAQIGGYRRPILEAHAGLTRHYGFPCGRCHGRAMSRSPTRLRFPSPKSTTCAFPNRPDR